jgi:hypothetical protein
MKTLNAHKISLLFLFFILFSCKESKEDKIRSVFAGENSRKWYYFGIDSISCSQGFYPRRVFEFFKDGRQIQYINNYTTKNLDTIPEDDRYNPGKWFIINDSVVSIESERNPRSGYYHKQNSKILYYSKDTIILQNEKKYNYSGISIFTRYKKPTQ